MTDDNRRPSFWSTLPGIMSGTAALLTALVAVYAVIRNAPHGAETGHSAPVSAARYVSPASPVAADQQLCDLSGVWLITHSNGAIAPMLVKQTGGALVGDGREGKSVGTLNGSFSGRAVGFRILWSNRQTGVYSGEIKSNGQVVG